MAEIRVEGDQISIQLSLAEKIGAFHGDLEFPRSAIRTVRVVEKPLPRSTVSVHQLRASQPC
jgi:hypothetical protein